MRKLKLQVQMSVDGFIAGPQGEMDWMTWNWSDDIKNYVTQITEPVDTILLGRNLAEGFIPYWTAAFNKPEPDEGSEKLFKTSKIVFSKTLTESKWDNTKVANGDLKQMIQDLKNESGGDMMVYGGGQFVSSLIKENLIDELHLFMNPVIIGKGMPIFQEITAKLNLNLISSKSFECGIVVLVYTAK